MGRLWRALTTSYIGSSIGAQHWYIDIDTGTLMPKYEVVRKLNRRDAAAENKIRRTLGMRTFMSEPGDLTRGFESDHATIEAAAAVFAALSQPGDTLRWYRSITQVAQERGMWWAGAPDAQYQSVTSYRLSDKPREQRAEVKRVGLEWEFVRLHE